MGKRKIDMVKIQDKGKRIITFSKRRGGLFKKAADYCRLSGANVALLVFSPAGKPFTFGHPSADAVFDRFLTGTNRKEEEEEEYNKTTDHNNNNADDHQRRAGLEDEGDGFWWDNIDMEELDSIEKIQAVKNAMLGLLQNVRKRIDELPPSSSSSSSSSYTAAATTNTTIVEDSSLFSTEGYDLQQNVWKRIDEFTTFSSYTVYTDPHSYVKPSLDHHPSPSPTIILDYAAPVMTPMMRNSFDCEKFSSWLLDGDDDPNIPKLVDGEADLPWPTVDEWEELLKELD